MIYLDSKLWGMWENGVCSVSSGPRYETAEKFSKFLMCRLLAKWPVTYYLGAVHCISLTGCMTALYKQRVNDKAMLFTNFW